MSTKPSLCITEQEANAKLALNVMIYGSIAVLALLIAIFSVSYAAHKVHDIRENRIKPEPALYILPANSEHHNSTARQSPG